MKKTSCLKGEVVTGLGEGKYYLSFSQYSNQFKKKFNFVPYPGTLNLIVSLEDLESFLTPLTPNYIRGFQNKERSFGGLTAYEIKINDVTKGALIIPDRTTHEKNQVEIVSTPFLRKKFSLKDGSIVTVCGGKKS